MLASLNSAKSQTASSAMPAAASFGGTASAAVSTAFNRRDVNASTNVAAGDSAWCSGGPYIVALEPGTNGERYQVTNANYGGGPSITVAVPTGAHLQGNLNGQLALPAGLSYTIETDGTNFIIV